MQTLGSSLSSYLQRFNQSGPPQTTSSFNPFSGDSSATEFALTGGVYYVGVSDSSTTYDPTTSGSAAGQATTGQYNLQLSLSAPVSDPNGTLATAAPVSFIRGAPVSKSGIIVQSNDADLYKLSLLSGDSLQLAVSAQSIGSPLASRLRVFDAAGNELGSAANQLGDPSLTYQVQSAGVYYVGVSAADNGAYNPNQLESGAGSSVGLFSVQLTVNSPPAVTQEVEPNNSIDNANSIGLNTSVGGAIGPAGDADYYLFTLTQSGQLTIHATPDSGSALAGRVTLYSSNGQALLSGDGLAGATASIVQNLPAGTYFVSIAAAGVSGPSATGAYHLSTAFVPATPPFADLPTEQFASALASGDFNGDGIPDLVSVDFGFPGDVSVLLGNGDGTFQPSVPYATDLGSSAVVVGDFNHDGHRDLAVTNQYTNDVSVLLGNGDGTFQPAVNYMVGNGPVALAVGDFNGDGFQDLAVANSGDGTVSILTGVGDGTFTPGATITVGNGPDAIVAGKFGGDTHLDLAVANGTDNTVSILTGSGDGNFTVGASPLSVGSDPTSIAVGDLNGDHLADLTVANAGTQDVSLLFGNANGTFQTATTLNLLNEPPAVLAGTFRSTVALADFNGDGILDVALANSLDPRIRVALGRGDGTFTLAQPVTVSGQPQDLAVADFAGTGRLGFAAADGPTSGVTVRLGLGDGSFQAARQFDVGFQPLGLTVGDFNNDGADDLATADNDGASVLMGNGDGTYQSQNVLAEPGPLQSVVSADVNGDGRDDLISTVYDPDNPSAGSFVSVQLGNGDGTFQPGVEYTVGQDPIAVAVGDFNGDGHLDIVTANYFDGTISVLLGNGDGTFQTQQVISVGSLPHAVAVGDLNGDGKLDIVIADSGSNDVEVLMGNGNGTFASPIVVPVGSTPFGVVLGDFNGDHKLDIATVNAGSNDVSVILNLGGGHFGSATSFAAGSGPQAIVAGDFNGDGHLDLATCNQTSNDVTILTGLGNGTFSAPASFAVAGTSPTALVAADLNGDGRTDLAVAVGNAGDGTVSVLLGLGDGTFVTPDQFAAGAVVSQPTLADVNGDGTSDSLTLTASGNILLRTGRGDEPGAFNSPSIINPTRPARSFTVVQSTGRQLIAAVDLKDNFISLYQVTATGVGALVGQLATALQPLRIAAGDVNGDGRPDLVVASAGNGSSGGTVSVFLGNAAGNFVAQGTYLVTDHPASVALVDLTRDGRLDIVVTDSAAGTVSVLVNQGNGTFGAATHYRATTGQAGFAIGTDGAATLASLDGATSFAAGDFNGDGNMDLVVVNPGDHSLTLLAGDGKGGFLSPQTLLAGARPAIVQAGHFFADGFLDLAVLDEDNHTITILRGDGHGNFSSAGQFDAGNSPNGLTLADFNRDGLTDLVVGNSNADVLALLGQGEGTFNPFNRIGRGIAIAVGNVTGNGQNDWIVTDQTRDQITLQTGGQPAGFTQNSSDGLIAPGKAVLADINGDGIADLIVCNSGGNSVLVYLGLGGGAFAAPQTFYTGTDPVDVEVADVNGDGRPDLVVTNKGSNDISILLGDPTTLFRAGPRLDVGLAPVATQVGKFTGDGQLDLLVTNSGSNQAWLLNGVGGGFFNDTTPTIFNTGANPQLALLGNFFGGSGLDLVTLNYGSNSLSVFTNLNPDSRTDISSGGLGPMAGVIGDFGSNGSSELVIGNNIDGSIAVFAGGPNGLFQADTLFGENAQHPTALALAGEGNDVRLLVADEGDENVGVFSRESVLASAQAEVFNAFVAGVGSSSFQLGSFGILATAVGATLQSAVGDLGGIFSASNVSEGGAGAVQSAALDQFVSAGTQLLDSTLHTVAAVARDNGVPKELFDSLDSVLEITVPSVSLETVDKVLDAVLKSMQKKNGQPGGDGADKAAPNHSSIDRVHEAGGLAGRWDEFIDLMFSAGDRPSNASDSKPISNPTDADAKPTSVADPQAAISPPAKVAGTVPVPSMIDPTAKIVSVERRPPVDSRRAEIVDWLVAGWIAAPALIRPRFDDAAPLQTNRGYRRKPISPSNKHTDN